MRKLNVAIIGIGGYGGTHVRVIMQLVKAGLLECKAFAEINPAACQTQYNSLVETGAEHYEDYREMLQRHPEVDFVVIPAPIPLHKPMCIYAMEQGFNVLLEKPPTVTIQDLEEMLKVQQRTGKLVQVMFQMSSSESFRLALRHLRQGTIGQVQSIIGTGMWQRSATYYARAPWVGKLLHKGNYVLDGTLNNPLSHLLNNCLIAAGNGDPLSAKPQSVQAELYRTVDMESENTASVRIQTESGVNVLFLTTLSFRSDRDPQILIQGDQGSICWTYANSVVIQTKNGEENFQFEEDLMEKMYRNLIDAIQGDAALISPLAYSRSFVLATNGAFESSQEIVRIPDQYLEFQDAGERTVLKDANMMFEKAAASFKLFSELEIPWAAASKPFALKGYDLFNRFDD